MFRPAGKAGLAKDTRPELVHAKCNSKGAQDLGLRISTLVNFISSDLIGGKTMEVIWAPIGGNIVGASVSNQLY